MYRYFSCFFSILSSSSFFLFRRRWDGAGDFSQDHLFMSTLTFANVACSTEKYASNGIDYEIFFSSFVIFPFYSYLQQHRLDLLMFWGVCIERVVPAIEMIPVPSQNMERNLFFFFFFIHRWKITFFPQFRTDKIVNYQNTFFHASCGK